MKQKPLKSFWQEYAVIISAIIWLAAWFVARAGLEQTQLPEGARVALALLPVLPFALFLWTFVSGIRSMDELERRIHLEALVLAYPLVMLLLMTLGLLELAVAAFAAASPWLYYDVLYERGLWLAARTWTTGLVHFAALAVSTTLMGMSLPFLVRSAVRSAAGAPRSVGRLYGVNVLGAACGALLTPWVLIRLLGLRGAIDVGVVANVAAGVLALLG